MFVTKLLRPILLVLLAGGWCVAFPAHAGIVSGLYEARVPVADQSPDARRTALQQAFAAVLVRITGERTLSGPLTLLSSNASQYLQQYRYEQAPAIPAVPMTPAANTAALQTAVMPVLQLWARFDSKVVNRAVQDAHAPLWGAERPTTMVWLALQDSATGRILTATDTSVVMQGLTAAASARGLNLVFPQMDGPDRTAIAIADVSGAVPDHIHQASARYKPDAILVGDLYPSNATQFAARWQLWMGPQQFTWVTGSADETSVAADGVQVAADRFAERLAMAPDAGDLNGVSLQVDGVSTLDAYARVLAYLGGLTPVRAVRVQRVEHNSLYLSVDAHGSLDNLQEAMVLGGTLQPVETAAPAISAAAIATAVPPATAAIPATPLHYLYTPSP
jgi:hypothetical protein